MDVIAELVEADRLEDAGAWEGAAWRRLRIPERDARGRWRSGHAPRRLEGVTVFAERHRLYVEGLGGEWRWLVCPRCWEYYLATTIYSWHSHDGPPPPWVRAAVEGAAALAVARALAALSAPTGGRGGDDPLP